MRRNLQRRSGRHRVPKNLLLGFIALLGLSGAGALALPTTASAVPGGYGPSGGWSGGGAGTLGGIIVAQTVGPRGATITGWDDGAKITVVIPPGAFPTNELVEIMTGSADCGAWLGHTPILGIAISHSIDGKNLGSFPPAVKVAIYDHRISGNAIVVTGGCKAFIGAVLNAGWVVAPLADETTIAVVFASFGAGGGHHSDPPASGQRSWFGPLLPGI